MYSALTLGKGHRVWWTLGIHRFAMGIGMPKDLDEWATMICANRVNDDGKFEESFHVVLGPLCFVRWRVVTTVPGVDPPSHPETT